MKTYPLLLALSLFASLQLIAQPDTRNFGPHGLVYRLDDAEARAIFHNKTPAPVQDAWFHTQVDTFSGKRPGPGLPPGQYLLVRARGEQVEIECYAVHRLQVQVIAHPRDFCLRVADSTGRICPDARVFVAGKRMPFDTALQRYSLPKHFRHAFVEVYAGGEAWFGQAENGLKKPLWVRWLGYQSGFGVGKVLVTPVRWGRWAYWKAKIQLSSRYRRFQGRNQGSQFPGYIALSKPKYQPGDTLQLKAYVTDRKGRPWRKPLNLRIREAHDYRRNVVQREIKPVTPGAFVFSMLLTDTLRLDKPYWVVFEELRGRKKREPRFIGQEFQFEDYQLDEVTFTLKPNQEAYQRGQPVSLYLTARDANNQPVPDATMRLVLAARRPTRYYSAEVAVADTLWQTEQAFSADGEATVIVPDSIWPEADLLVDVQADCSNSAGELQHKETGFAMKRQRNPLKTSLENGWLSIEALGQREGPDSIRLQTNFADGRRVERSLPLPWREPIRPDAQRYALLKDSAVENIPMPDADEAVRTTAILQPDSVALCLVNSHRLQIGYQIFENQRLLLQGITGDSAWAWLASARPGCSYRLAYQFLWMGEQQSNSANAEYYDRLLHIQMDQPEQVVPGETVQVKIQVEDDRQRPVSGVNLTAGAYNRQFGEQQPYQSPDITYRWTREAFYRGSYHLKPGAREVYQLPVDSAWYRRLGLDSVLYYRLRFRGQGWYSESIRIDQAAMEQGQDKKVGRAMGLPEVSDSFYLHRPQFAVHPIRQHEEQPVYLIYCNGRLVYYYGNTGLKRYSFYGWYGYNQIKIRTRAGEYTLDSVYLEAGKKLELAFDLDQFRQIAAPFHLHYEARPDTFTPFEQQLLRNSILQLRTEAGALEYIWSGAEDIQIVVPRYGSKVQLLGPFPSRTTLRVLQPGQLISRFDFEPGFEYKISATRERLYSSIWPQGSARLPRHIEANLAGQLAWGPQHIRTGSDQRWQVNFTTYGNDRPGRAALELRLPRRDSILAIGLKTNNTLEVFRPTRQVLEGLTPGQYRLLVFDLNGRVFARDIRLTRDTLLYLDLRGVIFGEPIPEESPDRLFKSFSFLPATIPTSPATGSISQWPREITGNGGIRGVLTDESGEALIGATVKALQGNTLIAGTLTDYNGQYQVHLPPGIYDVEFSYTGFSTAQISGIWVGTGDSLFRLDQTLNSGTVLQEVLITYYKIPLIQQDNTSAGQTLSAMAISRLATRNVSAKVAGLSIDGGEVNIKGARANAMNYYIDGVRVSSDMFNPDLDMETGLLGGLRSKFSDNAYWQPNLLTDKNGEAWFQVKFPDNITSWSSFVLGMDRRKRSGLLVKNTRASKPLFARLAVPRFALAGDRFDVAGLSTNQTGDSLELTSVFRLEDRLLSAQHTRIGKGFAEYTTVLVPQTGADSLHLSYEIQGGQFNDGEQRSLPVQPVGTLESTGQFWVLEHDTTLSVQFDPALGPVSIQAQDNALDLIRADIRYLREYPYDCNEQTSSRLIGLLAEKQLNGGANDASREKAIRACLQRLDKGQLADGSWGWWPGAAPNAWMTVYVLRTLQRAQAAGYTAPGWEKGLIWLQSQLFTLPLPVQRQALLFLREANVRFDCAPYLRRLDSLPLNTLYDQLSFWRLRQACDTPLPPETLRTYLHSTTMGGIYCGEETTDWYDCQATNTLLAYDIAQAAGWTDITQGIRRFWLEHRQPLRPGNTIETAEIVRRLVPELLLSRDSLQKNELTINGMRADTFPKKWVVAADGTGIRVQKTGNTPLYLGASQQHFNPAPEPKSDLFAIGTRLEQGGHPADTLRQGEAAELLVSVQVRQLADYVLVEVPIPAGCSYGEKRQYYSPEVHREYFRDRVSIFCESLPVGRYEFRIPLEPRFSGQFTLNPVRVEQMYFPVFYGRNGVAHVPIVKQ